MMKLKKHKKIILDVIFNTIAYALPVFAKQIIILPYLSRRMNSDDYGLIVTIISLLNIVPHMLGLTLNNVRLVHNQECIDQNKTGDFNLILRISCIIDTLIVGGVLYFYLGINNIASIIGIIVLSILWLLREYFIVSFRIKLDYKSILVNNLLMFLGFLIGLGIYHFTKIWFTIYLVSYTLSIIYIYSKSNLHKEKAEKTKLFGKITKDYVVLTTSNILDTCLSNIDKLFIFPILGGTAVSIYFSSTVYTKIISLIIGPLTSVILSYVAKEKTNSVKKFNLTLLSGIIITSVGYVLCIIFGKPILSILYPTFADEAIKYIYITSATSMLVLIRGLIRPFLLKFCKMYWQLIIDILGAIVYLLIAIIFIKQFNIWAICYAVFIATLLKLIIMIIVYWITSKKNRKTLNNLNKKEE